MRVYNDIRELIGNTPMLRLHPFETKPDVKLYAKLELWNPEKTYDRMGVDTHYMTILGVKVPLLTIPVKPGRNLAVILEVAAMNNRMKKMGYNAAKDLLHQLGIDSDSEEIMSDLNI